MPGEEEEQGIKNLFEKVMIENFPNMMRGIKPYKSKSTKCPIQDEFKEAHSKTHHNKKDKIKTKREY